MTKPIHAIVWDMGGVLLRTEDQAHRQRLAEQLSTTLNRLFEIVFTSPSSALAETGELPVAEHWKFIQQQLNLAPDQVEPFKQAFWAGDRVDVGLLQYISALRPKYTTGLLSNAWGDIRQVLPQFYPAFFDSFDVSIFSAEVGVRKPDLRIYRLAEERLGVSPGQAVFIDDYPPNIAGAQSAGWHGILFRNPDQAISELEALLNHR